MTGIEKSVASVRSRQQRQWIWKCLSAGLFLGGLSGCAITLIAYLSDSALSWPLLIGVLVAAPAIGLVIAIARPRNARGAAIAIDRAYNLKDRIATALRFLAAPEKRSEIHQLQMADADRHLDSVDPKSVAPIRSPRSWTLGIVANTAAIVLGLMLFAPKEQLDAAPVGNQVVLAQAETVEASLEELEKFNDEQADPEIDKLLKELAAKIEELKDPSLDPKEALAKLSEMEAVLQQQQDQLSNPSLEASLQAIGEALELAEPLASAGQAMANGKMEEAAEELEKLELPKLDRQTEKALSEKIEEAMQNSGGGSKRQLKEAVSQIAQSLGQGDKSKFKDGMQKLAGECRKQGRRNKLSDLLRKQCQCLSECKGECESECKSNSLSDKKGGKNWGLAASGNQPGDKTSKLKSPNEMKITGQESDSGDIETETLSGPEQEQEAIRQYRQQAEKYEQLSESVLDSEPIPLGHRQTIRKYFELIRPSKAEVDAVNKSNASQE